MNRLACQAFECCRMRGRGPARASVRAGACGPLRPDADRISDDECKGEHDERLHHSRACARRNGRLARASNLPNLQRLRQQNGRGYGYDQNRNDYNTQPGQNGQRYGQDNYGQQQRSYGQDNGRNEQRYNYGRNEDRNRTGQAYGNQGNRYYNGQNQNQYGLGRNAYPNSTGRSNSNDNDD
jgi:hypothetical protein